MIKIAPPIVCLGATLLSLSVCAFSLRANNEHMLQLRQAVYAADEKGSDIKVPLFQLQSYVTAHMNTKLDAGASAVYPPIQLKYSYDRLVKTRSDQLAASNGQTYSAAQGYCEQQNSSDFSGRNRVPCIEQYVQSHGVQLPPISDALYKFSFVSPSWSPDLAGWSLVITLVLALITFGLFIRRLVIKRR